MCPYLIINNFNFFILFNFEIPVCLKESYHTWSRAVTLTHVVSKFSVQMSKVNCNNCYYIL